MDPDHTQQTDPAAAGGGSLVEMDMTGSKSLRTVIGGALMGIANLIPGVSGGTMILAIGLYEEFIEAVAGLTALRWSAGRILFLVLLFAGAGVAIVGLSSVILFLLFRYSALMYALFIGLTLGGAPLLWKMMRRPSAGSMVAVLAGIGLMAVVAMASKGGKLPRSTSMDVVSGVVGSTTMVLPGISGSYMLLVLDQYDRVIGAVSDLKDRNFKSLRILIPVGIGAVVGIVGLSNLLKLLLKRFEKVTLGFLLGMLLGSVLGLWPFGRAPTEKILDHQSEAQLRAFADAWGIPILNELSHEGLVRQIVESWPDRTRQSVTAFEYATAFAALLIGMGVTLALGRIGSKPKASSVQSVSAD